MKNRMFGEIGLIALALTLAIVGVDASANQAQAADTKADPKMQECAKACSDCQRVCDLCATHCANLLADGKKEHLSCLMHCRDCATCCAACSQVCASGGPLSAVTVPGSDQVELMVEGLPVVPEVAGDAPEIGVDVDMAGIAAR